MARKFRKPRLPRQRLPRRNAIGVVRADRRPRWANDSIGPYRLNYTRQNAFERNVQWARMQPVLQNIRRLKYKRQMATNPIGSYVFDRAMSKYYST